jgi:NAD(P)H-flavin reductase
MNKIVSKKQFSENVVELEVEAPLIARSRRAGHFVIVRADEQGERIPLTIADSDIRKGTITLVIQREQVDKCVTIGPAIMMKFVALTTKKYNVPTDASLNTIMVDGTGMCGACRVTVGGVTRFVCVDGPEFDAHQVDFDEMMSRSGAYREEEQLRMEQYRKGGNA